jgi:hypothetical protein
MAMEWGVNPEDMVWYQERGENFSHTGASAQAGLSLPEEVELHYAKKNFATMYANGELDASIRLGSGHASGIDRTRVDIRNDPDVHPLFADTKAEAIRFFQTHGVYPPHHVTVVRERHPEGTPVDCGEPHGGVRWGERHCVTAVAKPTTYDDGVRTGLPTGSGQRVWS